MTPADTLRAAKALISKPAAMIFDHEALDGNGKKVHPFSENAVAFHPVCAIWHINKEICAIDKNPAHLALHMACLNIAGKPLRRFLGPYTDHATVMRMFDLAIEMAEEEE